MIKNEKQYQISKRKLKEFVAALKSIENDNQKDSYLKEFEMIGIKTQIEKFRSEINEYESIRKGEMSLIPIDSLESFNEAFIKARLIRGWSQADLASKLNLSEQQIQRYEATNYTTASMRRIIEISNALELEVPRFKLSLKDKKFNFSHNINQDILLSARKKIKERQSLIGI